MSDGQNGQLIASAIEGDQTAWNTLVARYTRLVWHVIHGFGALSDDDRADVHQTVWLQLVERLDTIRDPERVGSWLATTARNQCISRLRTLGIELPDPDSAADVPSEASTGEQLVLDGERDAALWTAFGTLRTGCQQLLRLLLADPPFSYDEIAEILDMPRGSIGPTRQRCLERLRAALDADTDAPLP